MMDSRSLRTLISISVAVSAIASILSALGWPYQFFVWEFFFDGRLVAILALSFIAWKRGFITLPSPMPSLRSFRWHENVWAFLAPLAFYALTIGAGMAASAVKVDPLDNAATLVLATLFDIPAIYVFSITSVLVEEFLFRGVVLDAFTKRSSPFLAVVLSSVLWTLFMVPEVIGLNDLALPSISVVLLFIFITGLFCSVIALRWSTIWIGYSFRVGIIALTPIIISSLTTEADAFFITSSPWFAAEGGVMIILMILSAFFLFRRTAHFAQKTVN